MMTTPLNDLTALAQTGVAGLSELPWGAHAIAAGGLIVGLALLLIGRRLLRPGVILTAAVGGGALAFYAPASLGLTVDPNVLMAVGLAAGAIAGVLLYRLTISLTLMVLVSLLAMLIAGSAMRLSPPPPPAESPELTALAADPGAVEHAATQAWERVRAFTQGAGDAAARAWDELDGREKSVLVGSGLLGGGLGLLLGAVFPKRSAAVMSAFTGSALVVPSGAWLLGAASATAAEHLPRGAIAWLSAWVGLSVVGIAVQWTGKRRRTDT